MAHSQSYAGRPTTTFEDWERTDKYFNNLLLPKDEVLEAAVAKADANQLPDIAVSAAQGKFLHLLARSIQAKRVIEVGTLGGYSTIWIARALPEDGHVFTYELEEKHAKVARENFEQAGLSSKITVVVGPAIDSLKEVASEPKFDLAFIDADKESNLEYFTEAKRLLRTGGVIIVDNIVRGGIITNPNDPGYNSLQANGVRRLAEALKDDKEVDATAISTVGDKGYDGFLYAIKL